MPLSDEVLLPRVLQWRCTYKLKHCPYNFWVYFVGLGARSIVIFAGEPLCVEVPVTVLRVYLGNVTCFWSTFVLGGGGNVTFHGIQDSAGILNH